MHFRTILFAIICFNSIQLLGQHRDKAQQTIQDLCSEEFAGRGYIGGGDSLAAAYIKAQYETLGLSPLSPEYYHPFDMRVNTIVEASVILGENSLKAGYDFMVSPASPGINLNKKPFYISPKMLHSKRIVKKVKKALRKGYVLVIPTYDSKDEVATEAIRKIQEIRKKEAIIFLKKQLVWSVATSQAQAADIWILDSVFNHYAETIEITIKSEFIPKHLANNVCAYVPGTVNPDSFIIICGHYDHLGKMGDATFYGANDNASGIAMMLDLADYFSKNPQPYSIAFVAFAAEEAGLIGSYHFVQNPPAKIPMNAVKLVFNMDLMGNGEDGATIVNGSVFKEHFSLLQAVNDEHGYLDPLKTRGKAQNSDHHFFTELGIPSFFIYLMGGYTHYHIPEDNAANLQLGPFYDQSFLLIRDFIIALNTVN